MDNDRKELAIVKAALAAGIKSEYLTGEGSLTEKLVDKVGEHLNEYAVIEGDGTPVPLDEYLDALRRTNRALFEVDEPGRDMTLKEKTEYIKRYGADKYAEMRSQRQRPDNPWEWTVTQKTQYIKQFGSEAYAELRAKFRTGSKLRAPGGRLRSK